MCLKILKNSPGYQRWFFAIGVLTFTYWFMIIPPVFYYFKDDFKISRTFVSEFWIITFLIWVGAISIIWFCYIKSRLDHEDEDESLNLLAGEEDKRVIQGLNDSVKKRLGLKEATGAVEDNNIFNVEECKEVVEEETKSVHQVKIETTNCEDNVDDADKPKKRGLISRFSIRRKTKTDSTESNSNIIQLPDFDSENSLSLLMPYGGYECSSLTEAAPPSSEKLSTNQGSPDESETASDIGTPGPETNTDRELDRSQNVIRNTGIEKENKEPETATENSKKLTKSESKYLLETKHNQTCSTSEIFLTINECGHLENEPIEFGKYEVLREM